MPLKPLLVGSEFEGVHGSQITLVSQVLHFRSMLKQDDIWRLPSTFCSIVFPQTNDVQFNAFATVRIGSDPQLPMGQSIMTGNN